MKVLSSFVIMPLIGAFLLSAGGCGGDDGSASANPERGEQQKQARINAYGKSGMAPTTKGSSSAPDASGQAARRNAGRR